ncbi:hypothetical protein Tco_0681302 [Tanacetum coccineum]|uniref:Uncharacterized protein n=1 Tax=Tanacetum coccineum TaxID=301880 RepID=A0ABQ4XP93_9ASTR
MMSEDVGKLIQHGLTPPQWRNIDNMFENFGNEIANLRFDLSSDGINPFGNMSSRHSTWPVILCVYNLPPWLCMKHKDLMMSLLIQGSKQHGNDIDVYLAPLIDDMKTLWQSGVDVYNSYNKEMFRFRAIIFYTINDFPAYNNLSGYSTKGLLLNIHGKIKDEVNVRKDMVQMGIRLELSPIENDQKRTYLPLACYTMSKAEKHKFVNH